MVVPKLTQKFLGVICIRYYFENKTIRAAIRNKEDLAIREQQIKHVCYSFVMAISSVIKQKGESQNGGNKTKHTKFSEKQTFLTPDTYTYVGVSGGQEIVFRKIWCALFCYLRFEISPSALQLTICQGHKVEIEKRANYHTDIKKRLR